MAEQQSHDAMLAGAEGETAAGSEIKEARVSSHLGHYRGETATAQPLLEDPQGIGGLCNADDDEVRRVEAEGGEAVAGGQAGFAGFPLFDHPENGTRVLRTELCQQRHGKPGHRGGVAAFFRAQLMERGAAEAAAEQCVKFGNGEGKGGAGAARGQCWRGAGRRRGFLTLFIQARRWFAMRKSLLPRGERRCWSGIW
jgi:hypothetical protein